MIIGFLADECFSGPLVRAMRTAGFDVSRLADSVPGASDEQVLAVAFAQNRILLTEDSDFGDLVVRLRLPTHGVVRVALKSLAKADRAARLVMGLTELGHKVRGAMVTIEPNRTRVRPLPGSTDHGDKE
jgi:predicted nuclease of predicted toxin-antitoxin system